MFDIAVMGMALVGATSPGENYTYTNSDVDYSVFIPFNSSEYFHPYCLMDYSNLTSCQTVHTLFRPVLLTVVLVWRPVCCIGAFGP
jgi:hypothetical protein